MKNLLVLIFTLLFSFSYSQKNEKILNHNNTEKRGTFDKYVSKNGDTISIGDTLVIGKASNFNKFVYINQDRYSMHADHSGKKVKIKTIETFGKKNSGYKAYFSFKGFGLIPVYVNYEEALNHGEIYLLNGKITREQALNKLKEQKELLDLQIIKQDEYDKLKEELLPIINMN